MMKRWYFALRLARRADAEDDRFCFTKFAMQQITIILQFFVASVRHYILYVFPYVYGSLSHCLVPGMNSQCKSYRACRCNSGDGGVLMIRTQTYTYGHTQAFQPCALSAVSCIHYSHSHTTVTKYICTGSSQATRQTSRSHFTNYFTHKHTLTHAHTRTDTSVGYFNDRTSP